MEMRLPEDFSEFLKLFRAHGVRHLLVGGWAVGLHGRPRTTQDLDVWVEVSPANSISIVRALKEFGFEASRELFLDPDSMIRMGMPPLRIEILNAISGVEFDAAHQNGVEMLLDGVPVRVISLADLRKNRVCKSKCVTAFSDRDSFLPKDDVEGL